MGTHGRLSVVFFWHLCVHVYMAGS